jgi:mannose-6-phosphate isomerase-like protein (cupin superfamily)
MPKTLHAQIHSAQVEVRCADMSATLDFLMDRLGFKVESIFPADSPTTAVVGAHGVRLRLRQSVAGESVPPFTLHLACDTGALTGGTLLHGPNGLRVELFDAAPAVVIPDGTQEFILTHHTDQWSVGRAGMQYRDLIPGRLGGRFVASHIRIPDGGPVPDYVHYHHVRFQMIFCKAGWVRVVYEDQGEPFVLEAGDCVLQPPTIRHRVLEASPGLEVIEIGCPAIHETMADPELELPNSLVQSDRTYGGQRFVRHIARVADWKTWPTVAAQGFTARDTGIADATDDLASVRVIRASSDAVTTPTSHGGELMFLFVLKGSLAIESAALGNHTLAAEDSVVIPAGAEYLLRGEKGMEMLEVVLPAV